MNYSTLKELYNLFFKKGGIFENLDASRYFSKYEIHENFKSYVYAIICNDFGTISYLLNELKESKEYDLQRQLETVYRINRNGGLKSEKNKLYSII